MERSLWSNRDRDVMRSLVVVEETSKISQKDFSNLQSHNFWNTISWKYSLKDDCTMQVLCTTWFIEVNPCKILMAFVSGINKQEEYCLSLLEF